MDCLIIGKSPETDGLCAALSQHAGIRGRCTTSRYITLAQRHLLYSTPDIVVIIGKTEGRALSQFSDMVDLIGCDQVIADGPDAAFAYIRHAGERPYAQSASGRSLRELVIAEVERMAGSRAVRKKLHALQAATRGRSLDRSRAPGLHARA